MSKFNPRMMTSNTDLWATPQATFDALNEEFHFTLDPCATHDNAKCVKYYTEQQDGLVQTWKGERVFVNPPFSEIGQWCRKAYEESRKPDTKVVMLIPARTDTSYFHDYILPYADIRFIRGRLHYNESKQGAPFPSIIVIFK